MGTEDERTRFLGRCALRTNRSEAIQSVQASERALLVYDADCGPCVRFKRAVDFLEPRGLLGFMSIRKARDLGLLNDMPDTRRYSSFHLIKPKQELESGAEALPSLIRILPLGWLTSKLLASAPGGPRAMAWVYSTAARLHGGACERRSPRSQCGDADEPTRT